MGGACFLNILQPLERQVLPNAALLLRAVPGNGLAPVKTRSNRFLLVSIVQSVRCENQHKKLCIPKFDYGSIAQSPKMRTRIVCFVLGLSALSGFAATPQLVPRPQQMTLSSGMFTLCPSQPILGAPAQAVTKILVDGASQENGQYLASLLLKSTGYRFQIATNSGVLPVKRAILLTTVNALTNLGNEGYELTVAPDSVVIRAPDPQTAVAFTAYNRCSNKPCPRQILGVPPGSRGRLDCALPLHSGCAAVYLARLDAGQCPPLFHQGRGEAVSGCHGAAQTKHVPLASRR